MWNANNNQLTVSGPLVCKRLHKIGKLLLGGIVESMKIIDDNSAQWQLLWKISNNSYVILFTGGQ